MYFRAAKQTSPAQSYRRDSGSGERLVVTRASGLVDDVGLGLHSCRIKDLHGLLRERLGGVVRCEGIDRSPRTLAYGVDIEVENVYVERANRVVDVISAAKEPFFMSRPGREDDSWRRGGPSSVKQSGELEHDSHARCVVVGGWIDNTIGVRPESPGRAPTKIAFETPLPGSTPMTLWASILAGGARLTL